MTNIGDEMFSGCTGLTSITIPNSVTSIGKRVFDGCTSLTSIVIPESMTSIGDEVFYGCTGLTSITIPNSVTSIGKKAFDGCTSLTSIVIPESMKSIGNQAFSGCTSLASVTTSDLASWCGIDFTSTESNPLFYAHHLYLNGEEITELVIPKSVARIGNYAFYGCTGLASITIPESVKSIGSRAFYGCTGLASVTTSDLASWCGISFATTESNPLFYAHHLYLNGEEITELIIPESVTSIGNVAFYGCTGLTSISISESVTSIGYRAFKDCTGLTAINSASPTPPDTDSSFDNSNYQDATLYVPQEALEAYKTAKEWKKFLNIQGVEITGIESIKVDDGRQKYVYHDLNGRRLSAPGKGLNIINGKKVVVK